MKPLHDLLGQEHPFDAVHRELKFFLHDLLVLAEGAGHILHVQRLSGRDEEEKARAVLSGVRERIDRLPPEKAAALVEALVKEYGE